MPIDPNFQNKRKVVSQHEGHEVWGPVESPKKLGIHGTTVAVDWDVCDGDGICVDVCSVNVLSLIDTPGHPISKEKSDPINEQDCVFCLNCETKCSAKAIKITPP